MVHSYPKAAPYKNKIIETLPCLSQEQRREALHAAGYNVWRLRDSQVYIDLADAHGNGALTQQQWAGLMVGDEAYAGSLNFERLQEAARARLGKQYLVPTHAGRGAEHLVLLALSQEGQCIVGNAPSPTLRRLVERYGRTYRDLSAAHSVWLGDVDLEALEAILRREAEQVAYVVLHTAAWVQGGQPFSLSNAQAVAKLARAYRKPLVLEATHIFTQALLWQEQVDALREHSLFSLVRELADLADLIYLSARGDLSCHVGGLILTEHEDGYIALRSLVVVFEGLHTYGGLAGRDMEAIAVALQELSEDELRFYRGQLLTLGQQVRTLGYPVLEPIGAHGVLLDASEQVSGDFPGHSLAAALYLLAGVRGGPRGSYLHLALPRRVYTESHLDYVVEALRQLRDVRPFPQLKRVEDYPPLQDEMARFEPEQPFTIPAWSPGIKPEPYRIKAIEPLLLTTRERRAAALHEAGWNTFLLRSQDVYIDFLTDSGTTAMSSAQWAEMVRASETLSYSEAYDRFVETIRELYGFPYVLPTHQGRAAEHVLSQVLIRPGQYVANNMYFTTTREHQERAGGIFVDVIIDEAHDPTAQHPFKGNMDPEKLRDLIRRVGPEQVAYVCLELNVNMAGGQPVSLENMRTVAQLCREFDIPLIFDATRAAENAYFIKVREPGMQDRSIPDIFRELMSYADGVTVSAKKDLLVNIGGFLAVRDAELYRRLEQFALRFEGHPADGGLARRDLVAMAQGAREMLDMDYLQHRIGQIAYLAERLREGGVPLVEPPGGHAVFIDARRFLPHLPQDQFPAQRLAGEIYLASGVRAMERGIVSAGRDPKTGQHKYPRLELVRLTIPRRVYTQRHLDVAAEGILAVFAQRDQISGLRMVFEPPTLRFFTARFEPLS